MMVNHKLGNKCDKDEMINMTRAWDKEKLWVSDRNRARDLPNTGRALYPLSYENLWRARPINWVNIWHASCSLLGLDWMSKSSWTRFAVPCVCVCITRVNQPSWPFDLLIMQSTSPLNTIIPQRWIVKIGIVLRLLRCKWRRFARFLHWLLLKLKSG